MDSEYADLARRRAELVTRTAEVEQQRLTLRVELEKLDGRLAEMWRAERLAARNGRRVPAYVPDVSEQNTAVPCGSGCTIPVLHSHFADGEVQVWASC